MLRLFSSPLEALQVLVTLRFLDFIPLHPFLSPASLFSFVHTNYSGPSSTPPQQKWRIFRILSSHTLPHDHVDLLRPQIRRCPLCPGYCLFPHPLGFSTLRIHTVIDLKKKGKKRLLPKTSTLSDESVRLVSICHPPPPPPN